MSLWIAFKSLYKEEKQLAMRGGRMMWWDTSFAKEIFHWDVKNVEPLRMKRKKLFNFFFFFLIILHLIIIIVVVIEIFFASFVIFHSLCLRLSSKLNESEFFYNLQIKVFSFVLKHFNFILFTGREQKKFWFYLIWFDAVW